MDGPPLAALGLPSPRTSRGPVPNRRAIIGKWPAVLALALSGRGGIVRANERPPMPSLRGTTQEMEWHMKRPCQRCSVISDRLELSASHTLQPEPNWQWKLLWRERQRHRPPSKR